MEQLDLEPASIFYAGASGQGVNLLRHSANTNVDFFKKILFIYLKGRVTERQRQSEREREKEREVFHLLVHSPDGSIGWI